MPRKRARRPEGGYLEHTVRVRVRFQEVDALGIVWHGHYLSYFEDGRAAFGAEYGLGYDDILQAGFIAPVVKVWCEYVAPARLNDELDVTTRMQCDGAAKLVFYYEIRQVHDGALVTTGETVQVFTDAQGRLLLAAPEFITAFLERSKSRMRFHNG